MLKYRATRQMHLLAGQMGLSVDPNAERDLPWEYMHRPLSIRLHPVRFIRTKVHPAKLAEFTDGKYKTFRELGNLPGPILQTLARKAERL